MACSLFFILNGSAQTIKIDPKDVDDMYFNGDYGGALKLYQKLLEGKPEDMYYHFQIGMCYVNLNGDKSLAIPWFEWATKQSNCENETWYELGKAYHFAYRFDDAINAFTKYISNSPKQADKELAEREIEECNNGKELVAHPRKDIVLENPGKTINSPYSDYYPWVSGDESILIFTSKRPSATERGMGLITLASPDIFVARAVNGVWQKAKSIGNALVPGADVEAVGLNSSADELIISQENLKEVKALYHSERKGNNYPRMNKFGNEINEYTTSSGNISPDGAHFFFASKRPGGYGGMDIYVANKLPNGHWSAPVNLGSVINTPLDEDAPMLDADGVTLYFSSQGHNSMGDFDLFKSRCSTIDSNSWGPCVNLGYPINSTGDDHSISFTFDHHAAYIAHYQQDGLGMEDISRVVFTNVERYAIIRGRIITDDTTKPVNAKISVFSADNPDIALVFKPVSRNGHFVMALKPGTYQLKVECDKYPTLSDNITVYDLGSFKSEMQKDFTFTSITNIQPPNEKVKAKPPSRIH